MHSLNINYVLPTGKYIPTHYFGLHNINGKISINCTKKAWTFLRLAIWIKRTFGYVDYDFIAAPNYLYYMKTSYCRNKKSVFFIAVQGQISCQPEM